ncbi:MAG: YeiH family putative sulfate export transporter [Clostridia bacterium]|nr:YeiH family putative sulfate export transporter [Clostridia bacterium]
MTLKWRSGPGLLLCLVIAVPAWFLGRFLPVIGGPVFGILMGILLANFFPGLISGLSGFGFETGIRLTSKKVLQLAVVLLGFEMNFAMIVQVGSQSLFVMLFTLSAAFLTAYGMGKVLHLDGKTATLIGVGTSICGGSAIAATAPVIAADDDEVTAAISTIFLFNVLAVFIFPALGHSLHLSDKGFGLWAGTAVNDTSSVLAAGTAWSVTAGNTVALSYATIVKLTRTLMIVPVTFSLAVRTALLARQQEKPSKKPAYNLAKTFPWFVLSFLAVALLNTWLPWPDLAGKLVTAGKFMIVMAMSAIGLNTRIKRLIAQGWRPILLGLACWFAVASISLIVQKLTAAL